MRFLFVVLVGILGLSFISCGHNPAYRNVNTSREVKEANQNSDQAQPAAAGAVGDQSNPSQATDAQGQPPAASQPFKPPKFMVNGQAKDIPNYPQALTKSIQFGPVQGIDTMSLVLETRDALDKITAFYEKAIKSNGWIVESKTVNSEQAEWNLKKTFDNEGKVQVVKDPKSKAFNIVIVRTEKISQ